MQKLLIPVIVIASLGAGCAGDPIARRLPGVYRIDIQQGNVIEQDAVNRLRPGMSREQVRFLLGTPMIRDPFHADRWDYVYLFQPGSSREPARLERLTVFFEDDRLVRLSGTLHPQPVTEEARPAQVVVVPPQAPPDEGILEKLWRWLGFGADNGHGDHAHEDSGTSAGAMPDPGLPPDGPAY